MSIRTRELFTTITTEGGLLPADLLQRIVEGDRDLAGLTPESYHLTSGERINEAVNRAWNRVVTAWASFNTAKSKLAETDPGTSVTRERWLLVLFQELGYGRLVAARATEIEGKSYPISHFWQNAPIHLVGFRVDLDRRAAGVAGAARMSPHSMVQEFLNRSDDHLWAFVSNGHRLRILRDNSALTRQAYLEFDLEAMLEGEVYADFVLLWLLCHQSRVEAETPEECWLERWTQAAHEQGTRALDTLREGVERAIKALGSGFLSYSANTALREKLRSGTLGTQDYYRQLLRLVYRFIFLFVAEDREAGGRSLLLDPNAEKEAVQRYMDHYSTLRLRRLAERRRGTKHADLYRGLRVVMEKLGSDGGCPPLALPALGSFLWSREALPDLEAADIENRDFLEAIRALAFTKQERILRAVDYKNLGSEELGSVYESLLELSPEINADAATFDLQTAGGHERKTTGSYYTPTSLIQCLLDSALDPVLDEACKQADPEQAILSLKVCDPATGSGHFLIAAGHRMARRLAAVRTGEEEPALEALRKAVRDIIGHCIYGVDINPMAVELCKVSLWMESLEPGKPLSFLEQRIQCGNSLLGTTPELLEQGIPDEAFKAITGDDEEVVKALRKQNREERKGQTSMLAHLVAEPLPIYGGLTETLASIDTIPDESIDGLRRKVEKYGDLIKSPLYRDAHLIANAWCAAFVWKKVKGVPESITHDFFLRLREAPDTVPNSVSEEIARLADQYQFFHWHLAFPDVFRVADGGDEVKKSQRVWSRGFDVVLGNPPWERIKLQEKEWFAARRPDIANASNAAARRRQIEKLASEDPVLYAAFLEERRKADGESHLVRDSGRYPLCGRGDVNTYALFAELKRSLISSTGCVGAIVQSGIATDDTTKYFFQKLMDIRSLVSLYDFENRAGLFPSVDSRMKFCLITLAGRDRPVKVGAEFAFFLHRTEDLRNDERRFILSAEEIGLLNPNTRTCPIFRSKRDAELTKFVYRYIPVLVREGSAQGNLWSIIIRRIFDMNKPEVLALCQEAKSGTWPRGYVAMLESKMVHQFNHRFGDYGDLAPDSKSTQLPEMPVERLQDPAYCPLPRYWVPATDSDEGLRDKWDKRWLLAWRDITNTTNERTVIASVLPYSGSDFTLRIGFPIAHPRLAGLAFPANLNSFCFDYIARQMLGGTHLSDYIMKQLPVLTPSTYSQPCPWMRTDRPMTLEEWLLPRILELTYTAWDLRHFACDCSYDGPPFRWDEERRFLLRCELDAAFFRLYGIQRDNVDYIMETFPIVKRKDEAQFGKYRTKRVILEIYDAMQNAIETGVPHQTLLDPPPADPRVAHPPREAVAAAVLPFRRAQPRPGEKYQKCVPFVSLKAAAGAFSNDQAVEFDDWVEINSSHRLREGMFVAQVVGHSMEPKIPDGSYCLFRAPVEGSRQGKILLVQHRDIHDPETGGSFTVKRYSSEKVTNPDGTWRHAKVTLSPLSPDYEPIVLTSESEDDVKIIAEWLAVLGRT